MSMSWTPKWAKNYVIKSNRSAMSIHPLAAGCSSEWLQGWLPMPATFQNLTELTVQVLYFAIICSYALAVHNTLPYCQDQRDKSPLPEHQLQSPKSTPLHICSEKKTRQDLPHLCVLRQGTVPRKWGTVPRKARMQTRDTLKMFYVLRWNLDLAPCVCSTKWGPRTV